MKEVVVLTKDMGKPFDKDPDWRKCTENLPSFDAFLNDYKNFLRFLESEIWRHSRGSEMVNRAYCAIQTDYSHPDIAWSSNTFDLEERRELIDQFRKLGHIEFANHLRMQRLMDHPALPTEDY
jgi:predicted ATP-binding protein involved in virulence